MSYIKVSLAYRMKKKKERNKSQDGRKEEVWEGEGGNEGERDGGKEYFY